MDLEEEAPEVEELELEKLEFKIPDQLKGLFCEPPLLEGEDPELYWGMIAAVIAERKPATASDWIAVHDLVTKLWEERVFRRASNALVRAGMIKALEYFAGYLSAEEPEQSSVTFSLREESDLAEIKRAEASRRRRESYFGKNAKERNEIRSRLARYGITQAELHAKAAQDNSEALQMFERMIASRERGRRKLRKEDRRRRRDSM